MIAIWIIVACALVVLALALLAGGMLQRERRRRREPRGRELARSERARRSASVEASRAAVKAALTEPQAAGEDWCYAQIEHDWRICV